MSGPSLIRVAVVGLGWAGRSIWLPRLRAHPAFSVVAAVEPEAVARASAARGESRLTVLAEIDDLEPAEVDLAVVAVPNHLHCALASRLLTKSIPVFLEKPVCLSSAEADQLAAAERDGGAVLLAGSAARYRADVRALQAIAGSLGRLRHVDVGWVRARGVPDAGGWFTQRQFAGGGALVDLGWHLLDTVMPLVGPVGFAQVVGTVSDDFVNRDDARAGWRAGDVMDALGSGDVEDTARGFLIAENGISVALRASWASHEEYDVTLIKLEGSDGTAALRCTFGFSPNRPGDSVLTLTRDGETEPIEVPDEPIGNEYLRQLDELAVLLADPAGRGKAVGDAGRTIDVIERLYRSARLPNAAKLVPAGQARS